MSADEHKQTYVLSYAVVTSFWMGLLYLVLHVWLALSSRVVVAGLAAVLCLNTAGFLIVYVASSMPSAEERLVARARYATALVLTLCVVGSGVVAWMMHSSGWRGWLVSLSAFVVAVAVCSLASRAALRRFLKRSK